LILWGEADGVLPSVVRAAQMQMQLQIQQQIKLLMQLQKHCQLWCIIVVSVDGFVVPWLICYFIFMLR
jgi:hypothetical protein